MIYTVTSTDPPQLTLDENDTLKSILQNVYLLLTTRKNTVPMYREFGIPMAFIDKPLLAAETIAAAEIREALATFEPRAELVDVTYESTNFGSKLTVQVEVGII